jgi:hypothetical protein
LILARAFGRWDVDQFLREITPAQFDEWRQFYSLQPWGPERDDLRMGMLASVLQILMERPSGIEPTDFYLSPLDRDEEAEQASATDGWEDTDVMAAKLRQIGRCWEAAH